jgi:hypothetical protein
LQFIPLCPPPVHPERSIGRPLRTVQSRAVGRAGFAGCVRCPSPVVVALVAWGG